MSRLTRLPINKHMVLIREQNFDVAIYVTESNGLYFVRYELLIVTLDADIIARINTRMQKSFTLNNTNPDARTEAGIALKAKLMRIIFKSEFGLNANIIYEF